MAELRWAESAVKDLDNICTYIAEDSEEYARMFARKIMDAIETTAVFPNSGRIVSELKDEKIREKVLSNYRIIYRINNDAVEVVRIIHNARNFKYINQ
ncbi:type II toxin-antitoxin system RelE/ParE family toxin [Aquibacillus koreensis]|uniref:Type II toxin-antitoxin system RelE/ParE family toxin n=1 Tax=Aquibacillus koreensis TaxID=279446 RepID=A0A9X3WGM4_9BACI|nr:type II toxin-antitoxin system RelE/ParE family toxin [Aquibacillus koreensis]MCT2536522.1 type II toxin-antitoxin system RelE/ParE family toxin [Aquibacillus koreensis]MDC3419390.1 type II toxin-antitoxin system RelE/ParE family toxin [Aquibacillus koreensis]